MSDQRLSDWVVLKCEASWHLQISVKVRQPDLYTRESDMKHGALLNLILLAMAFPTIAFGQDEVPWYSPEAEIDKAPAIPAPPPPGEPPKNAASVEIVPMLHVASAPVSGAASIIRARYSYQVISIFIGAQTPNAQFVFGGDLNPFHGMHLMELSEDLELWLLGPRVGGTILVGDVIGVGVYGDVVGARLSWCGPVCSFVDLRLPSIQGMLIASEFLNEAAQVISVGVGVNGGVAW